MQNKCSTIRQVFTDLSSSVFIYCINWKVWYIVNTPCPQKNSEVCFLAISQLLLDQIQKVRSVLKSAGSGNFKTVLTFDILPSRR